MYLSKFELNLRNSSARQALVDCEDMHRNIQKLFGCSREDSSVLYRIYNNGTNAILYIFSEQELTEENSKNKNGMKFILSKDMSDIEAKFINNAVFSFRLLAHPCKKVKKEGSKNSKRTFLPTKEEQMEWLDRKSADAGFQVLNCNIQDTGVVRSGERRKNMSFKTAEYTGKLLITDSESFLNAWKKGIGPEKAYGMGMMMVLPSA